MTGCGDWIKVEESAKKITPKERKEISKKIKAYILGNYDRLGAEFQKINPIKMEEDSLYVYVTNKFPKYVKEVEGPRTITSLI